MVTSPQCSLKDGGVTIDEGPHVLDALVVGLSLNVWEDFVWKLCGDLVHSECHIVNVKDSDFGALGKKMY